MAYWIQEFGNRGNGVNRSDYKMFHCDNDEDINIMPTKEEEGQFQPNDPVAHKTVKAGDQCLVISTGRVLEMGQDVGWTEL